MNTIGSRIRFLRKKRGLKQTALAQMVGITQGSLSLIENDETEVPAGRTLAGLCAALKTTPEFILGGEGDPDSIEAAIQENELIHLWRDMPQEQRDMLLDVARAAATRRRTLPA